jgi:CheY-like chemotaxis protein
MGDQRATVLLIDAEESSAAELEAMLQDEGIKVNRLLHPHEALFSLGEPPPTMLVLKSPLKGMSTASFLGSLQSVDGSQGLPIVLLHPPSADDAELAELLTKGLSQHLQLPVSRNNIQEIVASWVASEPPKKPRGPALTALIDGVQRPMVIEMALGKSLMTTVDGERIEVGSEFTGKLSYRDPAPGRNRTIPLHLKLRVGSCTPADERNYRCSLKVEDVRPAERWDQFVRVCKATLEG